MQKRPTLCSVVTILLATFNIAVANESNETLDDPILRQLQELERTRRRTSEELQRQEAQLLKAFHRGHLLKPPLRSSEIPPVQSRTREREELLDPRPVARPAKLYLSLKRVPRIESESVDPQQALSLKRIILPLPQDYAKTYLKMKTLLDPAHTYVKVHIDKSRQRMWVYLDNDYVGDWRVSTARRGYWTPNGVFRPYSLERMHYSKKYHHSPMPWSVFFKGGYAIHGTYSVRHLGHPASHGCVRVHPRNAKKLYRLIQRYGKRYTRIIIRG